MSQDFSGQELRGRSFAGQDLQCGDFRAVKAGKTRWVEAGVYLLISLLTFLASIALGLGTIWLILAANSAETDGLLGLQIFHLLVVALTNFTILLLFLRSIQQHLLEQSLLGFALLVVVATVVTGAADAAYESETLGEATFMALMMSGMLVLSVASFVIINIAGAVALIVAVAVVGVIVRTRVVAVAVTTILLVAVLSLVLMTMSMTVIIHSDKAWTVSEFLEVGAVLGTVIGLGASSFIIMLLITIRHIHQEEPQFSYLRQLSLQLATFGSTSFKQANLTEATFQGADLKTANFAHATLTRTNFYHAQNLNDAYFKNTILASFGHQRKSAGQATPTCRQQPEQSGNAVF